MNLILKIRSQKGLQLCFGFFMGCCFGFLLQKGGATRYDVILGQLLLTDFTVVKIMLSAMATGMIGIHFLKRKGLVQLHPKPGSFGSTVPGGLLFGIGFALLGYCPGTVIGAAAQGSMDALFGGITGILIGSGFFAALYPGLEKKYLSRGSFGELTLPQLFKINEWAVIIPLAIMIAVLFIWLEKAGL